MIEKYNLGQLLDPQFWFSAPERIQSLAVILSLLIGIVFILPRFLATWNTARATQKSSEILAAGHAWERFTYSMDHLRNANVESKVAAVLAIRNFLEQDLEGNRLALETLENYIREISPSQTELGAAKRNRPPTAEGAKSDLVLDPVPRPEIQAVLALLVNKNTQIWGKKTGNKRLFSKPVLNGRTEDFWQLDLSGTDLRGADLRNANLSNVCLRNCWLDGANMHGANLEGADLRNCTMIGTVLANANLSAANLWGANLRHASLIKTNFTDAIMWDIDLSHANLFHANLSGAMLGKALLVKTQMRNANLRGGNFFGAKFKDVNLRGANIWMSDLLTTEFSVTTESDFIQAAHPQSASKKKSTRSPLDEIAGIGPNRKRALLNNFGSAKAIGEAALADLQAVEGISKRMAQQIYDHFQQG